jgi:PAS domain-containing protein
MPVTVGPLLSRNRLDGTLLAYLFHWCALVKREPKERGMHRLETEPQGEVARQSGTQEFHRLLDKLPAAAYTCDAQGLITYFNRHALELWGRAPLLNDPLDRY